MVASTGAVRRRLVCAVWRRASMPPSSRAAATATCASRPPWLLVASLFFLFARLISTARNTLPDVSGRLRAAGLEQQHGWYPATQPQPDRDGVEAAALAAQHPQAVVSSDPAAAAASSSASSTSAASVPRTHAPQLASTSSTATPALSPSSSVSPASPRRPVTILSPSPAAPNRASVLPASPPPRAAAVPSSAAPISDRTPLCTLSTPGQWALTTGSHAPYDMRWRPATPCNYSVASPQRLLAAFAGMTLTFVGDSVTRNAVRALGKLVAGVDEQGFDEFEWHGGAGVTVRYRHSGTAQGLREWASDTAKQSRFPTFELPAGGVTKGVWVLNAGLWNTAWPNSIMNQNWSAHSDVTLPLVLQRYEQQLVAARDAILAALPALRDTCEGRSRAVFRLSTPVLNKVPARDGWLAWANAHFGDMDDVVGRLNAIARRVWGEQAGLPVIELGQLASAPSDVRPRLTLDNVHVPEGISLDIMWWLLSALHDAGLSTEAADKQLGPAAASSLQRGSADGWAGVCSRQHDAASPGERVPAAAGGVEAEPGPGQAVGSGTAGASHAAAAAVGSHAPTALPSEPDDGDFDIMAAELPGVPLALRRIAALGPARAAPVLPPLPSPLVAAGGRSVLSCSGGALPHTRRCRMANVCYERPLARVIPSEYKPRWVMFGGRVNTSEFQALPGYQPGVPCLSTSADAAGASPPSSVVCNGQNLLWAGSITENFMRLAPTISTAAAPAQGDSYAPFPGVVEWHTGRVVSLMRQDTTNIAHGNSDDLFPLLGLLDEAGGASAWGAEWAQVVENRAESAAAAAANPPLLRPGLESWPADREQPLVLFTDAGIGWLNGAYTAAVLHGLTRVHGPFALVAGAEPAQHVLPAASAANSSIALVCFRDVTAGVGGRGLFRGAGFAWDFAWTWSNAAAHWDRARFLAQSRQWFDHVRAVFGLPSLVVSAQALASRAAQRGRSALGEDAPAPVMAPAVARLLRLNRTILVVDRKPERPRHLENAGELAVALAALPQTVQRLLTVRVVDWEDLSTREIAATLASADVVISVHGAGNAHVAFATPGVTTWIEIVPEECAVVESMYEALARRAGVAWRHLPGARVQPCDRPWSVPGRMCKDPLGRHVPGAEFVADIASTSALVATVLAPPPWAGGDRGGGEARDALDQRVPPGPLAPWVAAQLREQQAGTLAPQRTRPRAGYYARTHQPRVVVFASFTRANRSLIGVGGLVAALTTQLDGERPHKAVPAAPFPGCTDVHRPGARPSEGKDACFDPAGLLARGHGAPLGTGHRMLLLDDTSAPLEGSGSDGGGAPPQAAVLAVWASAVRAAEVVVALHGSPAASLLPLAPRGADWIDMVPPRDAVRAVEYAPLAAAAGVQLHTHSLVDPQFRCDSPPWERPVLQVDGFALAAKVAILLGETDL